MPKDPEGPRYVVIYNELTSRVSRTANSALSSLKEFAAICQGPCNNVCEGIQNISFFKKKYPARR